MTEEDAKEMLKMQEELMAKLSEFEAITKHVQDLAGIDNISSSLLGTPVQCREINPCGPTNFDNFPKVICFDRISQHELGVPNMIVCEPVCKEKDPCGGDKQRRGPCADQRSPYSQEKRGFGPDNDAERYIQKEISHDEYSTEILGMLDRQGMLGQQPLQQAMRQGTAGMVAPLQTYPSTPGHQADVPEMMAWPPQSTQNLTVSLPEGQEILGTPQREKIEVPGEMMRVSPAIMGPQEIQPGMMGPQQIQPGTTDPQQIQPGMMGTLMQPGMMGPQQIQSGTTDPQQIQPGMMGTLMQPGMMGPQQIQPRKMGTQMQYGMMGSQITPGMRDKSPGGPQPGMLGEQGKIEKMGPQPISAMIGAQGQLIPMSPLRIDRQKEPLGGVEHTTKEEPEITVQQEIMSRHTTKRILGGNKLIDVETDMVKKTNMKIGSVDKTDAERYG